jgi:hypothetical protein
MKSLTFLPYEDFAQASWQDLFLSGEEYWEH